MTRTKPKADDRRTCRMRKYATYETAERVRRVLVMKKVYKDWTTEVKACIPCNAYHIVRIL